MTKYVELDNLLSGFYEPAQEDVIEIVQCKDCDMWDEKNKHGGDKVYGDLVAPCRYFSNGDEYIVYTKPNDYCSKGKRKEGQR